MTRLFRKSADRFPNVFPDLFADRGFTLMETLTAMMILAISLVTIFQLFSGGLNSARRAEDYNRAVLYAREKMDELLLRDAMFEGDLEGDFEDGYRWRARISALSPEGGPARSPDLFHVALEVAWGDPDGPRRFQLETVHIARKMGVENAAS